jgi:signal peptidase I
MTWLVVLAVLGTGAGAGLVAVRRRWTVVRVRGSSMEPALHDGDVLLARRRAGRLPRRGDIVVLRRPAIVPVPNGAVTVHGGPRAASGAGERWLIKRVVAVPGDPIPPDVPSSLRGPVPAGMVVVLGDRPGLDSRLFGPAPVDTVHATVVRAVGRARHRLYLTGGPR